MAAAVLMMERIDSRHRLEADLSDLDRAEMCLMRSNGALLPEIALKFRVKLAAASNVTKNAAPKHLRRRPASEAWGLQLAAERHKLYKFAVTLTRCPEKGRDLVQDTLCRAMECEDYFTQGTVLEAWLMTMMRNIYFAQFRKIREQEDPDGLKAAGLAVPPEQGHNMDLRSLIEALNKLPDEQAEAIRLVCIQGLQYDVAADYLDVKIGTIKSRVHRGRETLAKLLGLNHGDLTTDGVLAASLG